MLQHYLLRASSMPPRYPCRHRSGTPEMLPEEERGQSWRTGRGFTRERTRLRALTPADTTRPTPTSIRPAMHGQRAAYAKRHGSPSHHALCGSHTPAGLPKVSTCPRCLHIPHPVPVIGHGRLKLLAPQTAMAPEHAAQRQAEAALG
jgi:hypothetical protein